MEYKICLSPDFALFLYSYLLDNVQGDRNIQGKIPRELFKIGII